VVGSAFDHAPIGIAVLTPRGIVVLCNAAMGALLGRSPSDLVGAPFFTLAHLDDLAVARRPFELLPSDGTRNSRLECQFLRRDGTAVWVAVNTARVPDAVGRPAHLIMHAEDITERKAFEATLTHRALHDALTGLPNRVLLAERITHACVGRGSHSRPSCLFYIDLDGFKAVNDRFGHTTGDRVLQQLAERIAALLRPEDTAARLGGDEFAVLCVDMEPQHGAQVAERLRAAAAEPFVINGQTISVTAAVGVSTSESVDPTAPDAAAMLHEADRAMYEQKKRRATDT
jgi:diguanylate cyclase (GGDEF)-like protein/PAS domain S-box-containing protein